MTDLSEFLLARIAEDEAVAQRVGDQAWLYHGIGTKGLIDGDAKLRHSDRWMPSRVIAKCAADRRIVEAHRVPADEVQDDGTPDCPDCWQTWPCNTLRLLALPYADHPDYREEWKP